MIKRKVVICLSFTKVDDALVLRQTEIFINVAMRM